MDPTPWVICLKDQSRVKPPQIPTNIKTTMGGKDYWLLYLIVQLDSYGTPFPLMLDFPWLYQAHVKIDWYRGITTIKKGVGNVVL